MKFERSFMLVGLSVCSLALLPSLAYAEDCVGTLPGVNCTLDEDTTAALTIDNAVTLTIGGNVTIGDTIDGSVSNVGTITTNSGGIAVNQTAAIGGNAPIDSLTIGDGDSWTTSADIITNSDAGDANNGAVAADIDLGTADGGEILSLNGGINVVGYIDGHAGDTLNVGADGNGGEFTFNRQINTVVLTVTSGTLTASSSVGAATSLADLNIAAGSTLILNGAANATVTIDLGGRVLIGAGNTLTVQTYNAGANNGQIDLGLNRDGGTLSSGILRFTAGGPVDLSNATLGINIQSGSEVLVSETINNVIQGNGGATGLPTLTESSYLYDFGLTQSGANVDLTVTRADLGAATTSRNNAAVADVLLSQVFDSSDPVVQAAQANLSNASTRTEFNEILESTVPSMDHSAAEASNIITNKTISLAQQRLAYLRGAGGDGNSSGVSTGNAYSKHGETGGRVWGQVFGATGKQSDRGSINGYDANSVGVSFGGDTGGLHESLVVGALLTYANTGIDANDAGHTQLDIDSYLLGGYGTYEFDHDIFVNGTLTGGWNKIHSDRSDVGGTGARASSQYGSEQITFQIEVGKDYRDEEVIITPSLVGRYAYLETASRRERGVGGLNLTVKDDAVHSLEFGPRLETRWKYQTDGGLYIVPEVAAGYSYDFAGDTSNSVVNFDAGGPEIDLEGAEPQNHTFDVGFGGTLAKDKWEIRASYDFEAQGNFIMHSGFLRGAYKF